VEKETNRNKKETLVVGSKGHGESSASVGRQAKRIEKFEKSL